MALFTGRNSKRVSACAALLATSLLLPAAAHAQYDAPSLTEGAIGENYRIEVAGSLWDPDLFGQISSEQFGLMGTTIDFSKDLGYEGARFRDFRLVLRATKKAKFRLQYTPISYHAEKNFTRDIVFNGVKYPIGVPIESSFNWNVWRFGYEYDFLYKSRGFVGVLAEVRYTEMHAQLATNSPIISPRYDEFTTIKAPLPALGVVARAYPLKALAVNFEISGMRVPDIDDQYQGNYVEWNLNGTFNVTNYVGLQLGWRKADTYVAVENDLGDLKFKGLWFGVALRY